MRLRACSRGILPVVAILAFVGLVATAGFSQTAPQLLPNIVTTVAGTGTTGSCTPGTFSSGTLTPPDCQTATMGMNNDGSSLATAVKINQPYAVAVDSLGQMYIGTYDSSNGGYVFRVDTTGHISLFAGGMKQAAAGSSTCATGTDTYGSGCPANQTYNKGVRGIAVAPNGDVYYGDYNAHAIFKVDHATGIMSTFAGTPGTQGFAEGLPGTGILSNPYGIAFDKQGNLFIGNKGTGMVDRVDSTGYIHHVIGNGTRNATIPASGNGYLTCTLPSSGLAKDAQLAQPSDVAFDQSGNLYVGDISCLAVYKVLLDSATGIVDGNSAISYYAGTNNDTGNWVQAAGTGWQDPLHSKTAAQSVAVDFANNVYIGDTKTIWFCDAATNTCHSLIGSEGTTPTGCTGITTSPYDGCPGTKARLLNGSQILAFDPWGNLYFTDTSSSSGLRVRKLWVGTNGTTTLPSSSGVLQMLAHFGATDGPVTAVNPISGAPDFAPVLGTCTVNSADNTQDCVINATAAGGSSYLTEPFTLTSLSNATSMFYMSNNLYPTCQAPTTTGQNVTVTSKTADFTLSGQVGAGCSGIEMYPPTHHTLTYTIVSEPSNGTVTCTGGNCTYTPNAGYAGPDSFTFTANDPNVYVANPISSTMVTETQGTPLVSSPATVNITVNAGASPSNPAVTLAADIAQCSVGSTCNVTLTATVTPGTNPASTGLAVSGDMSACTGGSASQPFSPGAGNTFTYICSVPTASVSTLSFGPVTAADGQSRISNISGTVTFAVTLEPTNPSVVLTTNPSACESNSTCTVTVTAAVIPGINPDSTGVAVTGNMSACTGGSAAQAFTPGTGNTFTYACSVPTAAVATLTLGPAVATDGQSRTSANSNTVSLNVVAPPTAAQQNINVSYNTAKTITLSASGTGPMTYSVVSGPSNGTLSTVNGNQVTYTPANNYSGSDSFTFKANNGFDSAPATITLNVLGAAPVANPQSVNVTYNTAKTITLTATGTGSMTYSVVSGPSNGTLGTVNGNQVTYTPANNYTGLDSFTFKASNGVDSDPATVTLKVMPTAPVASTQSISVSYNTSTAITLSATGTGPLTYTVVSQPSNGQLTGTAPYLTYAPNSTYSGSDSFTFKATDSNSQDSATVAVNITVGGASMIWAPASGGSTTQTVTAGKVAQYFLQLNGWTGASGTVNFSCSGAPAGSVCTVGPYSATLNGTAPIAVTVSVVTAGGKSAAAGSIMPSGPGNGLPLGLGIALTALLSTLLFVKKSKMQWRLTGACAALVMAMALSACGNSTTATATPSGNYTLTVTATAGTVVKTTSLTLTVQ